MSSVTTNSEAVRKLLALRRETVASPREGIVREGVEMPIVHAWSIGTTEAAQYADYPPERRREECPPEVYIG